MIDECLKKKLLELTWDELRDWSDPQSVARGKDYVCQVETPVVINDGSIVSEVHGSDDYYARLSVDGHGELRGECTCPVGARCKHTVALALVSAKMLKAGTMIVDAKMTNRRWRTAQEELSYLHEDDNESAENSQEALGAEDTNADIITRYVSELPEENLRSLMNDLLENVPDAELYVKKQMAEIETAESTRPVKDRNIKDLLHETRQAISTATEGWYNPWERDGGCDEMPDYSEVLDCFKELKKAGEWRELMYLAKKLKKRGERQAEQSHDEGEIASQVSECMDVVVEAVMKQGDMDVLEKLKWDEDLRDKDDYGILTDMKSSWSTLLNASEQDWGRVIDAVTAKCDEERKNHPWKARQLRYDLAIVMERVGRMERAVEILKEIIPEDPHAYMKLVDFYERHERHTEAAALCRKALAIRPSLNCDYELRDRLQKIAANTKDPKIIAAQSLDDFLSSPYETRYEELKKACDVLGVWKRVHDFILRHYEFGAKIKDEKDWPLAKLEMTGSDTKQSYPCAGELIDIALHEKRMDDVVKWFRILTHDGRDIAYSYGWFGDRNEKVAEAIVKIAPELSLKVWQKKIAANCERPDRSCYANIGAALRKMRPVMERLGRSDEWQGMVDGLRTEYKRRSSLVKILNEIDREKGGSARIADGE